LFRRPSTQHRQQVGWHEDFEGSGGSRNSAAKPQLGEPNDHILGGWRSDSEETLDIGYGWWAFIDLGVCVDESEVLTLLVGEFYSGHCAVSLSF
jgi:hypothetical protein